jgi:hypothetical protein
MEENIILLNLTTFATKQGSKEIHHSWKQPSALLLMETFPNIFGKNLSTLCATCITKDYQRPWHKNTIGSV